MTIVQSSNFNGAAQTVPGNYIVLQPPQNLALNGVPTNVLGIVGTASYGPVNKPTALSTMQDYQANFGSVIARSYDMGTHMAVATQQGANVVYAVRVTDGTDTAASVVVQTNCLTLTALYTGTYGANIVAQIAQGTKTGTWKVVIGIPGVKSEVFDNIGFGLTAAALWAAFAAAINNGTSPTRPASGYVVATAGVGTTAPAAASYQLTGGNDGVASVTSATLIGQNVLPLKGMYALSTVTINVLNLVDATDPTTWPSIVEYAIGTATTSGAGCYVYLAGASGEAISTGATNLVTAGVDCDYVEVLHGNWKQWQDPYNGYLRLVSPVAYASGLRAVLPPNRSTLNQPLYGISGDQTQGYSTAQLQQLVAARINTIGSPSPGGNYYSTLLGINSSSNAATNIDTYAMMTTFIANTLNAGMGLYVGQNINSSIFPRCKATIQSFLLNLVQQGLLASTDGSLPFSVTCDLSNNPFSRTSLGYLQCDVVVQFQSTVKYMIVNLQGGQTSVIVQNVTTS
jgi:hypothetical protein